MVITIDKFGRFVLPKQIRENLGLVPGEPVDIEEINDQIVLKPLHHKSAVRNKNGVLVFGGVSHENLKNVVQQSRNKRLSKFNSMV